MSKQLMYNALKIDYLQNTPQNFYISIVSSRHTIKLVFAAKEKCRQVTVWDENIMHNVEVMD